MQVELLYFDGCPSYRSALKNLEAVLGEFHVADQVRLVRVDTPEEARQYQFLGSPTIRINGHDIDESAKNRQDYGLQCRVYFESGRLVRYPSMNVLRQAVSRELP